MSSPQQWSLPKVVIAAIIPSSPGVLGRTSLASMKEGRGCIDHVFNLPAVDGEGTRV